MDFSLTNPSGVISMTDVMVTIAAFLAGWIKYAQKAKDEQLAARDETIAFLKKEIIYLRQQMGDGK